MSTSASAAAVHNDVLEMESLVQETSMEVSNGTRRRTTHNNNTNNNKKWIALFFVVALLGALWIQHVQSNKPDPNTLETDINALPSVVVVDKKGDDSTTTTTPVLPQLPKPHNEPKGFQHAPEYFSDTYVRRARIDRQPGTPVATLLAADWGSWTLSSSSKQQQHELDTLLSQYPNRDIPYKDFPDTAWQKDTNYLQHDFLPQAIALTERALKAILAEYGHYDITAQQQQNATDNYFERMFQDATATDNAYMFNFTFQKPGDKYLFKRPPGNGGGYTHHFKTNLQRSLLHAVMTSDSFQITMGGHSSAAAHGNHFQQSYTLQLQRALEPVLARLGVYHTARNVGMGGLGTGHNALGSTSIYGSDNDMVWWDSGMTESDYRIKDLFVRQALLSPRVPVIYGSPVSNKEYPIVGSAFSGHWGAGFAGIPKTETLAGIPDMPYATRYIDCSKETYSTCRGEGYNGVCWIPRTDVEPPTPQGKMGGRAKWHPGNYYHQLTSRFPLYFILRTLRDGLLEWYHADNCTLPDEAWHVTPYYEQIHALMKENKFENADRVNNETVVNQLKGSCYGLDLPDLVCQVPFQARSEMTPRANPYETSIRSILHDDVNIPELEPNVYDPPDVYNPAFDPPDGHIDYLAIVENGVDFEPLLQRHKHLLRQVQPPPVPRSSPELSKRTSGFPSGQGWDLDTATAADNCDGTYDSFCNRPASSNCLLYAHNDHRGFLIGDGLSGWLLMTLQNVRHGTILVKVLTGGVNANQRTLGWKCENNATTCENPLSDEDANAPAGNQKSEPCTDYMLEFSVDGEVTSLSHEDAMEQRVELGRLVFIFVVKNATDLALEDGMDIELGIRVGGSCGRKASFQISHVYWA